MTLRYLLMTFLFLWSSASVFSQGLSLRINEFQASNVATLTDEEGIYSDWIELYNSSTSSVNLTGWSLTDDPAMPRKWVFPNVSLNAGDYLVVFASGNDRRIAGKPLHVGFKLSADGEYLALNAPDGNASTVFNPYPEQAPDQSYGYFNNALVVLKKPSPGKVNSDTSVLRFPAPVVSRQRGLYYQPFDLTLSCPMPNAAIYYTLDGSVPSPSNGTFYTKPLNISGTTVLRAVAIASYPNGLNTDDSPIASHTYLFPSSMAKQNNTPAGYPANWGKYSTLSGYAIADYEMDPVLMAEPAYAAKVETALTELPIISLTTHRDNLFSSEKDSVTGGIYYWVGSPAGSDHTGRGWERPVSFEYFFAPDAVSMQVDCGLELHGGHSRVPEKCPKHSFKLVFKSKYGPSKLRFPFFGKGLADEINAFNLRAGFGNTWVHQEPTEQKLAVYCRDEWAKQTQLLMGQPSTHFNYAHLFINGIYWGLFNPTEKADEDFCSTYLGGSSTEWDVIEVDESVGNKVVASSGTVEAWNRLLALMPSASDPIVYQQIQGKNPDGSMSPSLDPLLDVENFIDYLLLNFYGGNTDWDYHNWIAVRNRYTPDKGFRFICWDSEHMLKSVNENRLTMSNPGVVMGIFQQLRKNPLFVRELGDRMQKHCFNNGSLTPAAGIKTCSALMEVIDNSIYAESARWGDYRKDVHPWKSGAEFYRKDTHFDAQKKVLLETYFPQRTDKFVALMKTAELFPSVSAPLIKVNGSVTTKDTLERVDKLSLSVASGTIYYSKDNSDPVKWANDGSGAVAATAQLYTAAFTPSSSVNIKARALYQGVWSALNEQRFILREPIVGLNPEVELLKQISVTNHPNPFASQTTFRYTIPFDAKVRLEMFDVSGRLVSVLVNEQLDAGSYEMHFDGSELPRGIYLCRFNVSGVHQKQQVFKISKW